MRLVFKTSALCIALLGTQAFAATGTDASSILQQQQQLNVPEAPVLLPDFKVEEKPKAKPEPKGATILVKSIEITGAEDMLPAEVIDNLTKDSIGKVLGFRGFRELSNQITDALKAQGYLLARAYLPRQDITEGHIKIAILKGTVSKNNPLSLVPGETGYERIENEVLLDFFRTNVVPGEPLKESDLDRAVLLMNDIPEVSVRSSMKPGDHRGDTRVQFTVDEGPAVNGLAWIDNYGSPSTGINNVNVQLKSNNPSGKGDQATLSLVGNSGTLTQTLGYNLPVDSNGTRLSLSYADMDYKVITPAGISSGLTGKSKTSTIGLSHPIKRARMENIRVSGTYTRQDSKDDSTSGLLKHKVKRSGVLTFSGDKLDKYQGGGLNTWNLGLTVGDLDLKLAADAAADADAYQTAGSYSKITYGLARLQKLTGNYSLYGAWKGQRAHKNLDGSEQFSLGGPENVRAYPGGEASGDNGDLFNVELRYDYPEPTDLGVLQLKGFVDAGSIELHKDMLGNTNSTLTGENNYWIKGWGVGATLTEQNEYMLKAGWAKKIGDNPGRDTNGMDADGYNDASRIWAQFMIWF